jgi:hypothetical protein
MMYVVRPVDTDDEPHAFLSHKAAKEWAETSAYYQGRGGDIYDLYSVDVASKEEAIKRVKTGQAGKPLRVHRRLSAREIEVRDQQDAAAWLREIGLL